MIVIYGSAWRGNSGKDGSLNHIKNRWRKDKEFIPKIDKKLRNHLLQGWQQAIKKTLA